MALTPHYDYVVDEPSDDDEENQLSSEDELEILLSGTPEQKHRYLRECITGMSEGESEDDFAKEMDSELETVVQAVESAWASPDVENVSRATTQGGSSHVPGSQTSLESGEEKFYDDVYFETSSEDEADDAEGTKPKKAKKSRAERRVLTNEELMYDPDMDDADQAWVDAQRHRYRGIKKCRGVGQSLSKPLAPVSDAILNCPACMSTLCLDCQRHELYSSQYRAMFVLNCKVVRSEILRYKPCVRKGRRRRRGRRTPGQADDGSEAAMPRTGDATNSPEDELYHPVHCTECHTEVAVFDKSEVYHFFNVIASHC
uniref:E2F-associated phosphoprotein-like n=1 Tax=Myxine glutinosa TaxID=7769 RepID=UPI0035902692